MGLLDDAIRQHLELKRRHGADPSDVAKLEREAFGPSERFEPAAPDADVPGPEGDSRGQTVVTESPAWEAHESRPRVREPEEHEAPPPAAAVESPTPEPESVAPEAAPTTVTGDAVGRVRADADAEAHAEPAPEAPEPDSPRAGQSIPLDDVGERTVEFSAVDADPDPQPDAEPGEHDELEETPEFLQETPEHDRLWFEQKPPRDFDF